MKNNSFHRSKPFNLLNDMQINLPNNALKNTFLSEDINETTNNSRKMKTNSANNYGLKKFGYINNFSAQVTQFNYLLQGTDSSLKGYEIDALVDGLNPVNLNSCGYDNFHGEPVDDTHATYRVINTSAKTASGEDIVGLFTLNKKRRNFEGITWTTRTGLHMEVSLKRKPHIGDIFFVSMDAFETFLKSIAGHAVPEPWNFSGKEGVCSHPILKSYLENIFWKLKKESMEGKLNKVVYSSDGQHILFNTNLPDTFGNDILIIAEVRKKPNGEEYYENPAMSKGGIYKRRQIGFRDDVNPEAATFFEDVNEIIFQPSWRIDTSFEHLFHIIQDNRPRFPKDYQEKNPAEVAGDLEKAISLAVKMAKRNFKYIAPMYRPQKDCIQLLMPIYLNGSYKQSPDFALVLTPENGIYLPETILPIEAAYQNARLIAMPDEAWLKPDAIFNSIGA